MRRNTLNFIVDAVSTLDMLGMIATGLLIYYVLPPGSRGGHGLEFWGLSRHEWGDIHFWLAVALAALMILHVVLHWSWVCYTVRGWLRPAAEAKRLSSGARNLYGIGFFAVVVLLVGGFLWIAAAGVTRNEDDHEGGPAGYRGGRGAAADQQPVPGQHGGRGEFGEGHERGLGFGREHIRGSTTLQEAADLAGLSVEQLKLELGLPADVSGHRRLGTLRQEFGFEMSTVREIVAEHRAGRSGGGD